MSTDIRLVVDAVSNEKNVPKEVVFEAMEAALESATRKRYGAQWDVRVSIDRNTGEYATFRRWTVIDENAVDEDGDLVEFLEDAHYTLEEAKEKKPDAAYGDVFEEPIQSIEFGRIAAQTAKQVIAQRLRAAKRDQVAQEYMEKVGQLISGQVKKVTREAIVLELGNNAEAVLKRSEMLPREIMRVGDRVRAYLQEVQKEQRGPQLVVSRTCPEMLIELFRIEVPEIGEGTIEVISASRDPGSRAKIAVQAKDNRIDPVGACVGMRGARVQAVSNELGGERVDIVLWDENPAQYVINAISPAEVKTIVVDDETNAMDVIVDKDQSSIAIGRNGQNVRLASHLTSWTLNIVTEEEALEKEEEEQTRLLDLFQSELKVDEALAIGLIEEGFTTIEEVAYVPAAELLEVEGITEENMGELRTKAKDIMLTKAIAQEERLGEHEPAADLLEVEGVDKQLAYLLASHEVITRDDLAELSVDELVEIGVDENDAPKLIMAARAHWFTES